MKGRIMKLTVLDGEFTVWKLPPGERIPQRPENRERFWSVTCTREEISVISSPEDVPENAEAEPGWKILEVEGPLDFSMTGVLASLVSPLAEYGIPIFVASTFDTDYLLIAFENLPDTISALEDSGHHVESLPPGTV